MNVEAVHPSPDMSALEDMQTLAAAVTALGGLDRLTAIGGPLWGDPELRTIADRLRRKLMVLGRRATRVEPPPSYAAAPPAPLPPPVAAPPILTAKEAKRAADIAFLTAALARHGGIISAAAHELCVNQSALSRKLKKLGIRHRDFRPIRRKNANERP
jgi:hypothetical protein